MQVIFSLFYANNKMFSVQWVSVEFSDLIIPLVCSLINGTGQLNH